MMIYNFTIYYLLFLIHFKVQSGSKFFTLHSSLFTLHF
jgi:hypothetical protein